MKTTKIAIRMATDKKKTVRRFNAYLMTMQKSEKNGKSKVKLVFSGYKYSIYSDNIGRAYRIIGDLSETGKVKKAKKGQKYVIYPSLSPENGKNLKYFSKYVERSFYKWQLRNHNSANFIMLQNIKEREDNIQFVALAVMDYFRSHEKEPINELTYYRAGYNILSRYRTSLHRKSETVFNPGSKNQNCFRISTKKSTNLAVDVAILDAMEGKLTERQYDVLHAYMEGHTCKDLCDMLNVTKRSYYQSFYSAISKVLEDITDTSEKVSNLLKVIDSYSDIVNAVEKYWKLGRRKGEMTAPATAATATPATATPATATTATATTATPAYDWSRSYMDSVVHTICPPKKK